MYIWRYKLEEPNYPHFQINEARLINFDWIILQLLIDNSNLLDKLDNLIRSPKEPTHFNLQYFGPFSGGVAQYFALISIQAAYLFAIFCLLESKPSQMQPRNHTADKKSTIYVRSGSSSEEIRWGRTQVTRTSSEKISTSPCHVGSTSNDRFQKSPGYYTIPNTPWVFMGLHSFVQWVVSTTAARPTLNAGNEWWQRMVTMTTAWQTDSFVVKSWLWNFAVWGWQPCRS